MARRFALRFALQNPERLRSLVLIEPVAFHLLREDGVDRANRHLFHEVTELAARVSGDAANGDCCRAMARFVDYWNGEGAWMGMNPALQAALADARAASQNPEVEFAAGSNHSGVVEALRAAPTE